ncbi:MAG: hypothetical protein CMF57_11440 [Leifsonia sp.]|nr:hypothetical protein [Leifsonia sp.]
MHRESREASTPYAPVPASVMRTRLQIGSWFQNHERLAQTVGVVALTLGASYLLWRIVATRDGADPVMFGALFLAEVMGFAAFAIMVAEAWRLSPTPRPPLLDTTVDLLIATYDEDVDILEPTIVGALAVRGRTTVILCDDGRRPAVRALAESYGIRYVTRDDNAHAKAGNINAALPSLTGELLLILDADHVPSPDILEVMTGYFANERIALVQSAHSFRNHNSVMHTETGRHEQSLFFDVLLPGRNRLSSVFWCGSAALIRTAALREIGGVATQTSTEDFETSLLLQARGYDLVYHNEHLIQGLAPDTMRSYAIQRARWAEGTLSAFHWRHRLPFQRGLSLGQRTSYLGALLHYLTPAQRLVYLAIIVAVGWFGLVPLTISSEALVLVWCSWMLLSALAVTALHRGVSGVGDGLRFQLMSFESHLSAIQRLISLRSARFAVTPKNQTDAGGWHAVAALRVPITIAVVLSATVAVRGADALLELITGAGFLPPISATAFAIITVFALIDVVATLALARRLYRRRMLRRLWRFPVSLPSRLGTHAAVCVDLHQRGAAFLVPSHVIEWIDHAPVSFTTSGLDGRARRVRGTLHITSRRAVGASGAMQRVGGRVEWESDASRTAVVEHCYVAEPFRARQRVWSRSAPRVSVALEARLAGHDSLCIDVSLGGAALVTSLTRVELGDRLPLDVRDSGDGATGVLLVRSVADLPTGGLRVSGEVVWDETSWLAAYGALVLAPRRQPRRSLSRVSAPRSPRHARARVSRGRPGSLRAR